MPLSCFLCGQLLREGMRTHTLIATPLARVSGDALRGGERCRQVRVCRDCFLELGADDDDDEG